VEALSMLVHGLEILRGKRRVIDDVHGGPN
jgi:hypothetical protein